MVERDEASPKLGIPNPGRSGNRILGPAPAASNNRNQGKCLGTKPGALQTCCLPTCNPTNNHRPRQPCSNNKQPRRWHQRPHKEPARRHRGLSLPHQRTVMDWWLYLHTEVPDDPVKIARDQRWGQDALSTATDLITHNTTATTNDIGAPAEYDTAIDTSYQHNLGIQKADQITATRPEKTHFSLLNPC